ncbi:WD repeat-containing protein 5 [Stylophora pistillata]|uniref:WD repeat-containing protein 5 n=1 Tax=Stylophora pistillata TaxID=50429 RepID=A0A2B4RLZ3_STYPI|nr:WD repeat-containing protein 5 [Stylophora pistillata]
MDLLGYEMSLAEGRDYILRKEYLTQYFQQMKGNLVGFLFCPCLLSGVAVVLVTVSSSQQTDLKKEEVFERVEDFRLVGHVFKTFIAHEFQCGLRCVRDGKCWSYNHNGDNSCEMNDQTWRLNPVALIPANGFTYYERGTCLKTLIGHSGAVTAVHFSRDGTLVISCSYDGKYCVWDVFSGCCLKSISASQQSHLPISHATMSPNGKFLLLSTLDSILTLWDYKIGQGRILKTYQGHSKF